MSKIGAVDGLLALGLGGAGQDLIGPVALHLDRLGDDFAAAAMYVRQLVKANKAGQPLDDIIRNMNDLIEQYQIKSRPKFCAKLGMVDEVVPISDLRNYMMAFTQAAYQNPATICPTHPMLTPRAIREYDSTRR